MRRRTFLQLGAFGIASAFARSPFAIARSGPRPSRLRGLTIDAARLPEKPEYYRRIIDFCHDWGLNAVLFRLTDDQGSAFRFQSHPELITHEHALTPADARSLAEYGRSKGVTLIPEIESFGHTTYITATSKWSHLADTPAGGHSEFFGLCPVHPDSVRLMRDLYSEAAQAFDSPWLHGGCDEVNWGGSELSQEALKTKSRAAIWADYLNSLDAICRDLRRELIVWGDYVAHKEPDILQHLDKRVIVMDWQYYVTDPQPLRATAEKILIAGERVIGAPALISCEWGPRAGEPTLHNIDAYAHAYHDIHDERCLGVIVTNWIPSRYLADSLWDSFAYAAAALNREGAAPAEVEISRPFVEKFYGARWNPAWSTMFSDLYRITPGRSCAPDWKLPRLPLPSANDEQLKRALSAPPLDPEPYRKLASDIRDLGKHVGRNRESFQSFLIAADYLAYVIWREAEWKRIAQLPGAHKPAIDEIVRRDRDLLSRLERDWDRNRFADDRAKRAPVFGLTAYDQPLLQLRRAADYAGKLANDPSAWLEIVRSSALHSDSLH